MTGTFEFSEYELVDINKHYKTKLLKIPHGEARFIEIHDIKEYNSIETKADGYSISFFLDDVCYIADECKLLDKIKSIILVDNIYVEKGFRHKGFGSILLRYFNEQNFNNSIILFKSYISDQPSFILNHFGKKLLNKFNKKFMSNHGKLLDCNKYVQYEYSTPWIVENELGVIVYNKMMDYVRKDALSKAQSANDITISN